MTARIAPDTRPLLTLAEAAERLRVSEKTLTRWIRSGALAAHKVGRQWRISETDLAHFLKAHWTG